MVAEVLDHLRCSSLAVEKPDAVFCDATLGTAGHTLAILEAHPTCRVIAFDRDRESMEIARKRLDDAGVSDRVTFVQGDYRDAAMLLQPYLENLKVGTDGRPIASIDGALIDAGMSLYQVTWLERGISFRGDAPLDMRFDRNQELSAFDLVNRLSTSDLEDLLFKYSDERWARRIATTITSHRSSPIRTTSELVQLIEAAIPIGVRRQSRVHPATKTFAALRMYVNDELWALDQGAWALGSVLATTARLAILTYSSNEDRIVKNTFRTLAGQPRDPVARGNRKKKTGKLSAIRSSATAPSLDLSVQLPFEGEMPGKGRQAESVAPYVQDFDRGWRMKIVTNKPIAPTPEEIAVNPLARSCKLRAVEKVTVTPNIMK